MFFETERLPLVQEMILAETDEERAKPLAKLLPFQRADFVGLFRAMDGLPVTIRLIDPPLHEFLPSYDELAHDVTQLETRAEMAGGKDPLGLAGKLAQKKKLLAAVEAMREAEPDAGSARRAPGHPPAAARAHAGARHHRGRVPLQARRDPRAPEDHDPAHRAQQRAQGRGRDPRGGGPRGHEGTGHAREVPVRHHDRDPARGHHGR